MWAAGGSFTWLWGCRLKGWGWEWGLKGGSVEECAISAFLWWWQLLIRESVGWPHGFLMRFKGVLNILYSFLGDNTLSNLLTNCLRVNLLSFDILLGDWMIYWWYLGCIKFLHLFLNDYSSLDLQTNGLCVNFVLWNFVMWSSDGNGYGNGDIDFDGDDDDDDNGFLLPVWCQANN